MGEINQLSRELNTLLKKREKIRAKHLERWNRGDETIARFATFNTKTGELNMRIRSLQRLIRDYHAQETGI